MRVLRLLAPLLGAVLALPAAAQIPNTLKYSVPAPPVGFQTEAQLGYSVAVDGDYTVVGAPFDDIGGRDSGVVKVFDSMTGALLFALLNPSPAADDRFGNTVAISGTRVVVGAYFDNTGNGDAGSAYVYDLSSGTPTVPVTTLNNPSPEANDRFGNSVAISGTRLVVGAPYDGTGGTDGGSAYVYDLASGTPTVPSATLRKPGPAYGDLFGYSVAISGTRIVVGAYQDDTGATNAGSAYAYDLNSGMPTVPVATLNNPSPAAGDGFGYSVAISGTRVVVGAPYDETGASDAGSVYVYDLSSGTPALPVATLSNPGPAAGDNFGNSVAISGTRVVVRAAGDNTGASDAGSGYVYDLSSSTPIVPVATLNNPGPAASDSFGYSVAISGTRVVVGAPYDDTGASDAGSAYVYDFSSGTPTMPVAALVNPGVPAQGDNFGASVAISGTLMVVGSPEEDTGATNAGSAYVYDLGSGTPAMPVFTLHNPAPAANVFFGDSVAISGTRVVVGAYYDGIGGTNGGSAYVYDLSSGTPTVPAVTLNNPSPAAGDGFGYSVAISGTRVAVGAPYDDTGAMDAGSTYVYNLSSGTPTVPVATLNNPSPAMYDFFGNSVAISGTRVVVGAPRDNTGASAAGSAYVYDLSSGTPTVPVVTLNNPSPAADDNFGISVAISGTRVVVGASADDTGAINAGSAYAYDLSSGTPTAPVATLNNPGPGYYDAFGSSVAISGTRVVVGAQQDDTGATDSGSAYVYDLSSGTPTVPVATLSNPGPAVTDLFGAAVAIDGTTVAIGTPRDDTVMLDKGAAYVFGPAGFADIAVEQPAGSNLVDGGGAPSFGGFVNGTSGPLKVFTVKNSGTVDLSGLAITKDGTHSADYIVSTTGMATTVIPGGSTTFTVTFSPGGAVSAVRTAAIHIASNDPDENPFDIALTGQGLSTTADTDGDGLNDWAEFQYAPLGFDWQVSQTALVNTLISGANAANLYTPAQVQALNVGTPLVQRNPATGIFTLTIGVQKTTNLSLPFTDFPMNAPGTTTVINGSGKLEFGFTVPDNAAFFRLEVQ